MLDPKESADGLFWVAGCAIVIAMLGGVAVGFVAGLLVY